MKKIIFLILLSFISFSAFAGWFMIKKQYRGDWRVEMTSEIRSKKKKIVIIMDYFEPFNYSNIYNAQQAIPIHSNSKGDFTKTEINTSESQLKRMLIRMQRGSFFLNQSYRIKTQMALEDFNIQTPYPFQANREVKRKYMDVPEGLPKKIKKTIARLKKSETKATGMVLRIYEWMKNNIQLNLSDKKATLSQVVQKKSAGIQGVLDLWVTLLRTAGIPARIVHGYSLSSRIEITQGRSSVLCAYPKGSYHWLEVFFEGAGWFPVDPFANTLFFIPPNLIRKTTSVYFKNNQDKIFVYPKKPKNLKFRNNIFSEKELAEQKIKAEQKIGLDDFLFSPVFDVSYRLKKKSRSVRYFLPKMLGLYDNPLKVDVPAVRNNKLSQVIALKRFRSINEVQIPVYSLEVTRVGTMWLELENRGKTYRSKVLRSFFKRSHSKYRLARFRFSGKLKLKGKVKLRLKIKNMAAVLWYGIIGNPVGTKDDTLMKKGKVMHIDLCYWVK